MSDLDVKQADGSVTISFDEGLYPKDAIYGAAYIFIDRCYVKLDRDAGKVSVRLKLKPSVERELDALVGEFENEILGQAWRRMITDENRELIQQVTSQAMAGAAGPPGLDDLLEMNIDDDTAFEDPLGIAMSWEDKYKKVNKAVPFDDRGDPQGDSEDDKESKGESA
ncbi:MAG: His-Xaa-Ser system protein HxsD [Polyangiaceae bacterium]|nr:His-Xaa-Ser system protein HxsD [Polyangiaceae bacterium]